MFEWNIDPVLITIGPFQIRYYGILFATAFLLGLFMLRRHMRKRGQDPMLADTLLTYLVIGVVLGARLIHVLFYNTDYYFSNPSEIYKIWHGGVASHGAVLGVILAAYIFVKRHKQDFWDILDSIGLQFIFVGLFIRLGNFFNSEIVGKIVDVDKIPWAVKFLRYDAHLPAEAVPWRHPSQFYEMFNHILGYVVLLWIYKKYGGRLMTGALTGLVFIWYFLFRFITEFFKAHQTLQDGLTMGHWLSIPFFVAGILLFYWRQKTGSPIATEQRPVYSEAKEQAQ